MKRILSIVAGTAVLGLTLSACGGSTHGTVNSATNNPQIAQVLQNKQLNSTAQTDENQLKTVAKGCVTRAHIGPSLKKDVAYLESCVWPSGLSQKDYNAGEACLKSKVQPVLFDGETAIVNAIAACAGKIQVH